MPYLTGIERLALAEGEANGRAEGEARGRAVGEAAGLHDGMDALLELRFGDSGLALMPAVRRITDAAVLRSMCALLRRGGTLDELHRFLPAE